MSAAEQLHDDPSRVLLMRGSFDTLKDRAGACYDSIPLADVEVMARTPATADKRRAPCVIFSTYTAHDGRSHQAQAEHGAFIALPGDIDQGDHHIADVDAALVAVYGNVRRLIYSTASATPDNRKWRYVIPLAEPVPGSIYASVQLAAFELMAAQGITCDRALSRPGQVAYLPNVPPDRRDADGVPLFYDWNPRGEPVETLFSLSGSVIEARMIETMRQDEAARQAAQEAAQARRGQRRQHATGSALPAVIDAFNAQESIGDLLASYGYQQSGRDWQSPHQQSGSYATRVLGDAWVSLSQSDADAGLGTPIPTGGCWGDAFDLFLHFEHQGDRTAALTAAAKAVILPDGRTLDEARRDEWKAQQPADDGVTVDWDALLGKKNHEGENVDDEDNAAPIHPLLDFIDIATDMIEAPEFIVDDVLQAGVIVVAGASGSGKTTILVPLMAIAAGLCPPGHPLRARLTRRVIYVTEDPDQVQRILASFMRFSGFPVDEAAVRDRFRIVRAHRLATHNIVKVAEHYAEMAVTNHGAGGRSYDAMPAVVFDTTNASIDLDDENSNAEVGKAIAMLKARFNSIPAILTGHTAKVNKKADVDELSARGAGAWGADAHQNIFVVTDEHDPKARYLSLKGKKRFETEVDEIRFTTVAHQVMAFNKLGEPVMTWIRHAVPDATGVTREEIQKEAKAKAAEAKLGELMDAIVSVVQKHNDKGVPINRSDARAAVTGNNERKGSAITRLILDGALVEVKPEVEPRKNFGMALLTRSASRNELGRKYREGKDGG